jgi:hypothetical protein
MERQRTKHGRVHGAEHRRSRPDAERQYADHRRRETGTLAEPPQRITSILPERIGATKTPGVAAPFGHLHGVTEPASGRGVGVRAAESVERLGP